MSKVGHFGKHAATFSKGTGFGGLTVLAGAGTVVLGTVTVACFLASPVFGLTIPLMLLAGAGTAGCGVATWKSAKKTGRTYKKAFKSCDRKKSNICLAQQRLSSSESLSKVKINEEAGSDHQQYSRDSSDSRGSSPIKIKLFEHKDNHSSDNEEHSSDSDTSTVSI